MVGTKNVVVTRCSDTRRNHSPASKRFCTTEVLPECKLPSMPREPPTWKNGTHIIPTDGAASARNDRRHSPDPPIQLTAGDADRLGQSGCSAGEQDQCVCGRRGFRRLRATDAWLRVARQIGLRHNRGRPRVAEPVGVGLAPRRRPRHSRRSSAAPAAPAASTPGSSAPPRHRCAPPRAASRSTAGFRRPRRRPGRRPRRRGAARPAAQWRTVAASSP